MDSFRPRSLKSDSNIESVLDGPTPIALTPTSSSEPCNENISFFSSSSTLTDIDSESHHHEEDLHAIKTISNQITLDPSCDCANSDPEKNSFNPVPDTSQLPYHVFSRRRKKHMVYIVSLAALFSPLSSNIYFPALGDISQVMQLLNIHTQRDGIQSVPLTNFDI